MSNSRFAYNPTRLDISRSRFKVKPQHKTSFNMADLVPILCQEVLPGDTWKIDLASLVRMSTPIAPIMDNLHQEYWAFFVPMRLVWEHTEEFYGANKTGPWANTTDYTIPSITYAAIQEYSNNATIGSSSIGNYLGLPITTDDNGSSTLPISILPLRAYCLIWNEWFRDENVMSPILINNGDSPVDNVFVDDDDFYDYSDNPLKVSKYFDYFTGCLPAPQKGDAVSVCLTGFVPLSTTSSVTSLGDEYAISFGLDTSVTTSRYLVASASYNGGLAVSSSQTSSDLGGDAITKTNLGVDLSDAAAITINQLRYAFQLQKLLERDARGGTRFFEMLQAHFGVTSPDARLQRPEYLGGFKCPINIDQVLNTEGYSASTSTTTGATGAVSVTGSHHFLFTKSFVEPGYVFILTAVRQDQTYSQGVPKMFLRQNRFDFYYPEFANLGESGILKDELYFDASNNGAVFGYQEAWADYRYIPNRVSGVLDPSASNSLDFWTLANKFSSVPTLSADFIKENRNNIQRALTTGSTGPDFIADFLFNITMTRPMPMYSIPGLIDHH